ncbi:hypothetical protein [Massilia glaciei]|uniref:Uncharacterized protein n=1 Tax=Massilia glaciei TaxID=1524097 RepID=A0A2U2HIU6_9BURK|nr:hypothetical protein [Massilia glaciei]PWF46688.1 hypothetical protein C7C56_015715 [Massilia glaciei]
MNTKKILLAALLGALVTPVFASIDSEAMEALAEIGMDAGADADGPRDVERHVVMLAAGDEGGATGHGAMAGMRMRGKLVKNAPYSAEVVSERVQHLSDGNQISNKSSTMSYRDSAGRTRTELRDKDGAVRAVTITDPVGGSTFLLNPQRKIATKLPAPGARGAGMERIRMMHNDGKHNDGKHKDGNPGAAGHETHVERHADADGDGEKIIVKRIERAEGGVGERVRERVRVHVMHNMAAGDGPRIGPIVANAFGDVKWSAKAATKDLGAREFDGVKAEGKQRSYEIPAGEVGNRSPITVTHESWFAPSLQVTVYTKHSDPRSGERIYRLANVKRDEPAAALFTVPSDYSVRDLATRIRRAPAKQ